MAPPADNRWPEGPSRKLLGLLAPSPGRVEFATRQALICALTTLVVQFYQTPDAALTVYVVFFLNRADRASSLLMNVIMALLIAIVVRLVLVATIFVIDQPVWRVACIAALSFGLLFLTSASKLRPVGTTVALIVGYGLDLLGTNHSGEVATRGLLYALLFGAIPGSVSLVVNLLIAPSPRRLAERALAERLRASAAVLRTSNEPTRAAFKACLRETPGEIPAWLKLAGMERTSPPEDIAALRHAAEATAAILLLVDLATQEPALSLPASLRERLSRLLDNMAGILEAGGYPVGVSLEQGEDEAGLSAAAAALMAELRTAVIGFAEPGQGSAPPPAAKPPSGFFLPDAFSNPEHVHYALKTTAAAMFCYGLYSLLDWPGIHTCFLTCYIVALATTAETVEKLTLRVLGCLLGAGAGLAAIVFVVPSLTSIGALMTIVFAGAFVAAWVAGGSQSIAYAGFQIAFAFFLCVIQGTAPAVDLAVARHRVVGVLLGDFVAYLVFVHVWPLSIAQRIDPAIAAMLHRLSTLASTTSVSARRGIAAAAMSAQGAIERDLNLSVYEPRRVRPSPAWLQTRLHTVYDAAALTGPILLAADLTPALGGSVARRLSSLADRFAPAATLGAPQSESASEAAAGALQGLLDQRLTSLAGAIAGMAEAEGKPDHASH